MRNYRMILSKNHIAEFGYKDNANIILVGQVGTGKTRKNIIPCIMEQNDISMVIADTKGELYAKTANMLKFKGYDVKCINFDSPKDTKDFFNPFEYINDPEDIIATSSILVSELKANFGNWDPYWDNAGTLLLNAIIAYLVFECRKNDQTLANIQKLISNFAVREDQPDYRSTLDIMFDELKKKNPEHFAVKQWDAFTSIRGSSKTVSSITSVVMSKFAQFMTPGIERLTSKDTVDFKNLGKSKTVLFVSVSDVDRSKDKLASICYSLMLNTLRKIADKEEDKGLPNHVHFFLDDFATNVIIPNFDGYISCLRSREISFTIVLQSESQLYKLYGPTYNTILANAAYYIFLGSRDLQGCQDIAKRMNVPLDRVLYKSKDEVFILSNFERPIVDETYDLKTHPDYSKLESENYCIQSVEMDL